MIELIDIAQYGVAIVSIVILYLIVKMFLASLSKRDDKFIDVITNHFHGDLESRQKLGDKFEKMGDQIEKNTFVTQRLIHWLDNNNHK